jgi:hypothetical protein
MEQIATDRKLFITRGCGRQGEPAFSELVLALVSEEAEREAKMPTLLQMAKEAPAAARASILAALQIHNGNGEAARRTLGEAIERRSSVSRKDWQTTVELLGLQKKIEETWPKMRGGAKDSQ